MVPYGRTKVKVLKRGNGGLSSNICVNGVNIEPMHCYTKLKLLPLLQAWGKYTPKLEELAKTKNRQKAVTCLNELITNALQHVPDVLIYLSRLQNQSVFNFCAIPQVQKAKYNHT